jgi:hypothetical protein
MDNPPKVLIEQMGVPKKRLINQEKIIYYSKLVFKLK